MADFCGLEHIKTNTLEAASCQEPAVDKTWGLLELELN